MKPTGPPQPSFTRAHFFLLYLVLTAGIASGLAIFSSASTIISLIKTASAGLFLPLLIALILTFLLDPLVTFFERWDINRSGSIFIVFLLVTLLLYLAVVLLTPHWQGMWDSLRTDIPRYTARAITFVKDIQTHLHSRFPFVESYDFASRARTMAEELVAYIVVQTPKSAMRLGSLMILVPLFSFFFLRDGQRILRLCIGLSPNRYFEMMHDLTSMVSRQMAHFIRGRILEAFIIGVVVTLGLSLTDIRYAPILGFFAGVTNLIPYIGPLAGMIPGILIALVDLGMGGQFWWIVTVYILIAQVLLDNFILIPILISRVSNLHPMWVILAIIMGGKLYGVLGMIIGVPVASIIKIAIEEVRHYRRAFSISEPHSETDSFR